MSDAIQVHRTSPRFVRSLRWRLGLDLVLLLVVWNSMVLWPLGYRFNSASDPTTASLAIAMLSLLSFLFAGSVVGSIGLFWQWSHYRIELFPGHVECHGLGRVRSAPWCEIGKVRQMNLPSGTTHSMLLFPNSDIPILLIGLGTLDDVLAVVRTKIPTVAKWEVKTVRGFVSPAGLLVLEAYRKLWHDIMSSPSPYDVP